MSNADGIMIFDKPFIDDIDAVGKWEYFDLIKSENDFDPVDPKSKIFERGHKVIYFMPSGQAYWIYDGWTKGFLYTHAGGDEPVICNRYTLRDVDGEFYMLLEYFDDSECCDNFGNVVPEINVLKKVSSEIYTTREIGRFDDIDLPFIMDEAVIGSWVTIDFVSKIDAFDPDTEIDFKLYLKSIIFNEDGTTKRVYDDDEWTDRWTHGKLIDTSRKTAASYELKSINGKDYLFVEWKMGNYQYGGCDPEYYVLVRSGG